MTDGAHRLRFTGSGSEYFRIWIVNLLLTLVTLGFFSPWAKIRRLRYFYGNTYLLDAPFDFHGRPLPILVGRVFAIGMLFVYSNPQIFSWQLSMATAALIALLLPLLMQRSLRFRLRNTSWRNLRFGFAGTALQAYQALWQPVLVAVVLLAALALASWAGVSRGLGSQAGTYFAVGAGMIGLVMLLAVPLLIAAVYTAFRRYAGNHASFGSARFALELKLGAVVRIQMKAAMLSVLVFIAAAALFIGAGALLSSGGDEHRATTGIALLALPVGYLGMWAVTAYSQSRTQKLVWNNASLESHRFSCDLRARSFAWLMVKNLLLTIVTLGLYRPFAAVAKARAQIESVSFIPAGSIDEIVAKAEADSRAIGEEFVDALDFDLSF